MIAVKRNYVLSVGVPGFMPERVEVLGDVTWRVS